MVGSRHFHLLDRLQNVFLVYLDLWVFRPQTVHPPIGFIWHPTEKNGWNLPALPLELPSYHLFRFNQLSCLITLHESTPPV